MCFRTWAIMVLPMYIIFYSTKYCLTFCCPSMSIFCRPFTQVLSYVIQWIFLSTIYPVWVKFSKTFFLVPYLHYLQKYTDIFLSCPKYQLSLSDYMYNVLFVPIFIYMLLSASFYRVTYQLIWFSSIFERKLSSNLWYIGGLVFT